jgi:hypothetical protein
MPKMDPAAPHPPQAHPVPLAYDRTQAYDAKLAALGQQANSSCFTGEMADATFFAQRPHLSKRQVLFALVRRQIISTMLSRLLLARWLAVSVRAFRRPGRPLVPLGLEVGSMDRLMGGGSGKLLGPTRNPASASRGKIAPTSWCCALRIYEPGLDGPVARSGMLWGLGAHGSAGPLQFPAWMRQGGSVAPADHLWPDPDARGCVMAAAHIPTISSRL